ncbi:cell differentiation protein RCD1 [Penicillium digitatum]|uniref:GPI anchored protein n=3 Tax=Penicillium digitatum TaxID=36651 RepID=K9FT59_PEND2|nr:hypothetical protein PDIP_85770 [Penicillium digitatum Pd1]EKV04783.1 hypothetical protein PDIP_85770 [Penicillium digitatum Pd1]EKV12815.1 hypothetical protein PDIG_40850 [Penicillium digitatum PHI26]KAG0160016.1 hypothetical protein PDIDSM_7543 [Penicillium digitatum]QQK45877.1 cell differentiation protein RCD1 [Penicillium digitatum]
MRSLSVLPLLSTLALLLNYSLHTAATPLALEANIFEGNKLEKRCANPCGYNDWLCCEADQTCTTNSAQEAVCANGGSSGSGGYQYFTTTYTLTNTDQTTVTSVWSSQITAPPSTGTCRVDLGETKCGSTCCEAAQECSEGQCVAESSSIVAVTATGTGGGSEATPPVRGTTNGATTVTATSAPTTTEGFTAPVGTDGADLIGSKAASSGGLSGGAIAGIVIGSIIGAFLLALLCACICFKGVLDGLLAALGIGKKRRRQETTYIEERHSRHSRHSNGSRPPPPPPPPAGWQTWFGTRPAEGGSEVSEKEDSKWGLGTIAIILGALALCLGLKRKRDREHDDDKTESSYPSSYYYYSDYYSGTGSSQSSDRRTRDTRRSRRSRTRSDRPR